VTIFNQLDTGGSHPWQAPTTGMAGGVLQLGSVVVVGSRAVYYPIGRAHFSQQISLWIKGWQALGGQSANTGGALKYLLSQLEELAGNREMQPVYIQWNQTADGSAPYTAVELHDGWYIISDFQPDYARNVVTGFVQARMSVERVAPPPPTRVAYGYATANLSTNFVGSNVLATTVIAFPVGTSFPANTFPRTTGEGAINLVTSASAAIPNPLLFQLSATVSNWWLGGCHVYDTINTGSNPVPTSGGTFKNANWVEVLNPERYYQGDAFVTNGLLGLLLQTGTSNICSIYLWNTALVGGANWQLLGTLQFQGSGGGTGNNVGYSFDRIGFEEVAFVVSDLATATGGPPSVAQFAIRLQRGAYGMRLAWTPLTESFNNAAGGTTEGLHFFQSASTPIVLFNPGAVAQMNIDGAVSVAASNQYGYAGIVPPGSTTPYVCGFLYQNQPAQAQPYDSAGTYVGLGDGPAVNATKNYGFFAIPFVTTQNLQAEGESGTLGTGWSSVADVNASAGNTAKAASGTTAGNADLFGTAWQPPTGNYDVWFRVKVTSAAGSQAEMTLGLWDATSSTFVNSTTFRANQATTGYTWLKAAGPTGPTAGHNMQFRAVTALTLGTDWFIDEAVLVPDNLQAGTVSSVNGPQDLFNQFLGDFSNRQVRL